MADPIHPTFLLQGLHIQIERLLPMKVVVADERKNATFRRVLAAIRELKLIEPVMVYPQGAGKNPNYSILDGNTRFEAMKKLGYTTIPCLIATEDEAYTYNHKVSVVPPIQEHKMIMKAIESGVSEERIAKALDVDVQNIRLKRDLLNGICPEAIEILKNKFPGRETFREMRKVKPMR